MRDAGGPPNRLPSPFPVQPAAEDTVASEQSLGQKLVIWGTDVNVATCKENFQVRYHSSKLRKCGSIFLDLCPSAPVFRHRCLHGSES